MNGSRSSYAMRAFVAAALLGVSVLALAAGPAPAQSDIEAARKELRLRIETERRMREEFESLLSGARMTAEEIADFEGYLARLGTLVDAQRRTVARLEGGVTPPPRSALPEDFDRGRTDEEKLAMLDAELGDSLSEFDEKLLREQREIAEKSRSSAGDGSEGLDGASGGSQGRGADSEGGTSGTRDGGDAASGGGEARTGESEGEAGGDGRQAGGETPDETGSGGADGSDQVASAGGDNVGSGSGRASPPPDIPDGEDDDIVARQLREAAENEEDPELREKLWEEYRKYKQGTR